MFVLQKKKHLFHTNQSGFVSQHSCQTHWLNFINSNRINGSVFIDFKNAFDTINHTILATKKRLSYFGSNASCVEMLSSFLTARGQCVSFKKSISLLTYIEGG